jgi:hypothetical protein
MGRDMPSQFQDGTASPMLYDHARPKGVPFARKKRDRADLTPVGHALSVHENEPPSTQRRSHRLLYFQAAYADLSRDRWLRRFWSATYNSSGKIEPDRLQNGLFVIIWIEEDGSRSASTTHTRSADEPIKRISLLMTSRSPRSARISP